ncbi:MAG TPA: hypothetical protein VK670_16815, partial [Silvibacterium sp.]|nr:hypothetical protein [Silvibacterium sp.]
VNIWGGGSLTFEDTAINFHAHSILVENGGTLQAGAGNSGAVNGPLSIWLWGSALDGIPSITCKSGSTCGVPQAVWDSNPNVPMQKMPMGPCTPAAPNEDCFYQYEKFDPSDADGTFFGKKVLALSYGGTIILRGAKGIRSGVAVDATPSDSGTSWVRLTDDLPANKTTFHVDRPVPTWSNGDHIVLTSTDYLPSHSEEVIIDHVGSDNNGTLITLQAPAKYPHSGTPYSFKEIDGDKGPADDLKRQPGAVPGQFSLPSRHLETRAAVALLTRSIMVASEGDTPVLAGREAEHFPSGFYGGHTVVRQGFKQFQIQGVEYYHLGQGGVIGRYPVHFHMDRKAPQPTVNPPFGGTYVVDSSIHDSNTRFITVHATEGVLLARNVGYRSIGHGFYLEDATEINNRLYSNIGIQARAAVYDDLNDRSVPGILARPGDTGAEVFPYHSDWDHPSIFWIMNTWNDFQYNVAVGAGACGACYWMPPSEIGGPSVYETWDSYAGMQGPGRGGATPLLKFVGNSCSTAMNSLETVGNTSPCLGVTNAPQGSDPNTLYAVPNNLPTPYPALNGDLRQHATLCGPGQDCSTVKICEGVNKAEGTCAATVIDHYTTSFNWASKNFAAVWLRGWWYLLQNSAITDVQGGGLTAVTGGGYTRSDVAQGFWNLSLRNLYVGHTQPNTNPCTSKSYTTMVPENAAASNAGPFNPCAITTCSYNGDHCVSKADGISIPVDSFGNAQRLFNIYDGPTFEESDAFADVNVTKIGTLGACKEPVGGNENPGSCQNLGWENGFQTGVLQDPPTNNKDNDCYLPNAAIAWKQPNGFYYPPAFHSENIAFQNVDIRHYVVEPLWLPNSFDTDFSKVKNRYCSWEPGMFGANFTDIDRQTELSDDDGTLTGLTSATIMPPSKDPTISVNEDPFFKAPLYTQECSSSYPGGIYKANATAYTSPYQYVSTVVYPDCTTGGGCANWGANCTNQSCYGVPLYRQYLTPDDAENAHPEIRLMGQVSIQRSNLTLNHGSYYIDTTVPASMHTGGNPNVFKAGQTYYVFFLYATPSFHQTYTMYIGKVSKADGEGAVQPARVTTNSLSYVLNPISGGNWVTYKNYDINTGFLTVTVDLGGQTTEFQTDRASFCQPASYCAYSNGVCGCAKGSNCNPADNVCSWGVRDIDCPIAGCFGFAVTMPGAFALGPDTSPPPAPVPFSTDGYFKKDNVTFGSLDSAKAGECYYSTAPVQPASPATTDRRIPLECTTAERRGLLCNPGQQNR